MLHEDDQVIAFEDANPEAPVHVLVIPRRHVESLATLGPDDAPLVGHLLATAAALARTLAVAESGYRVVFNVGRDGGMAVRHLHAHLLGGRRMAWPPG
jgi:histidine triad (HIT) family protein